MLANKQKTATVELREFLISDAYVVTTQILSFISFGEAHFCLFVFRICICFFRFFVSCENESLVCHFHIQFICDK